MKVEIRAEHIRPEKVDIDGETVYVLGERHPLEKALGSPVEFPAGDYYTAVVNGRRIHLAEDAAQWMREWECWCIYGRGGCESPTPATFRLSRGWLI